MTVRLHSVAASRSFRVLWLLHELGQEVEVVPYQIADGSLHTDAFKAISPARRVPVLEQGGAVLFESGAIVQHLCETHPEAGLMPAVGDPERPDWLMWLHYAETISTAVQNLNMQHLFLADPSMRSIPVMAIETKRLALSIKALERALAQQDYLLSSGFSAADIMMGFTLPAAFHYVEAARFPQSSAYLARLEQRAAYKAAQAQEGPQAFYTQDFYPLPEA